MWIDRQPPFEALRRTPLVEAAEAFAAAADELADVRRWLCTKLAAAGLEDIDDSPATARCLSAAIESIDSDLGPRLAPMITIIGLCDKSPARDPIMTQALMLFEAAHNAYRAECLKTNAGAAVAEISGEIAARACRGTLTGHEDGVLRDLASAGNKMARGGADQLGRFRACVAAILSMAEQVWRERQERLPAPGAGDAIDADLI